MEILRKRQIVEQLLRSTAWVTELIETLQKNAFADITLDPLTWGTSALITARR